MNNYIVQDHSTILAQPIIKKSSVLRPAFFWKILALVFVLALVSGLVYLRVPTDYFYSLQGVSSSAGAVIKLEWDILSPDETIASTIYRTTDKFLSDPEEKYRIAEVPIPNRIYWDGQVKTGINYFYTIFFRDSAGEYFDPIYLQLSALSQTESSENNNKTNVANKNTNTTAEPPSTTSVANSQPGVSNNLQMPKHSFLNYPVGSLIKMGKTVHLITESYVAVAFTSEKAFNGLGYSWKNVIEGDLTGYRISDKYYLSDPNQGHPWSAWVEYKKTVYYINPEGLIPVSSYELFLSNGGYPTKILPANFEDLQILKQGKLLPLLTLNDTRLAR